MPWIALFLVALALPPASGQKIPAIRVWNDKDLADWATPVAGLNVRPGHYSEKEYYAAKEVELLRTFPVYVPGREPNDYFSSLMKRKPERLIRPGRRTRSEWIAAGQIAFRELDVPAARSHDPDLIAAARSVEGLAKAGARPQADGTIDGLRWVPTKRGLALSVTDCSGCHTQVLPDGTRIDGAPLRGTGNAILGQLISKAIHGIVGDSRAEWNWRSAAVPWLDNDPHERIRTMPPDDLRALFRNVPAGAFARFNGSPYFPTKTPDLIGIADRRYIDHTATHRHRGAGDLARYAALVSCCDIADFGPHRLLSDRQRRIAFRFPDDALYALAEYIRSLQYPRNPHRRDPRIARGMRVFEQQGCGGCHTPPLYTNNKLTLATGFVAPPDHPLASDIIRVSVGSDPGLALRTRKGTGLYKVPSLRGVWYRPLLSHDGSVTSLEEWFDPDRLRDGYVPPGAVSDTVRKRAVPGHEFGLTLAPDDKAALIAFLRSL